MGCSCIRSNTGLFFCGLGLDWLAWLCFGLRLGLDFDMRQCSAPCGKSKAYLTFSMSMALGSGRGRVVPSASLSEFSTVLGLLQPLCFELFGPHTLWDGQNTKKLSTNFSVHPDGQVILQQVRLHPRSGSSTMIGSRNKVGTICDLDPGLNSKTF